MVAALGEHILARHFLCPDLLEVVAGPANAFCVDFWRPDLLKVVATFGEHIFAHPFLCLDLLEVVVGPGEHMFARHFLRLDLLERGPQ